ncbi:hypothetical protein SERLA73DRAFT_126455 [Serpula lacrymans var. lacrymans S7.3]|uniref:Uncharacterized protein n=1 Tax=Serpula lacrymans var. lacrymans (strain S7.3) TaxID=936435 RepID=F8QD98_SERL3|nr:hypothetical protein SERLA73DRAFT_126455 [Serpula lacrymans var. lacrymans S7.3]
MLSQRPLEDILDLLPDARIQEFAPLVGDSRIVSPSNRLSLYITSLLSLRLLLTL